MKVTIPYNFEIKQFVKSEGGWNRCRGHYETYHVKSSAEVEIRDLSDEEAPVAARVTGHEPSEQLRYHVNTVFERRADGMPIELRWFDNRFWVDRGSVDLLAKPHKSWEDKRHYAQRPPFSALKTRAPYDNEKTASLDRFPDEKTKDKMAERRQRAEDAAARLIIVDGRLYQTCPEPVVVVEKSKTRRGRMKFLGFNFISSTPEHDCDFHGVSGDADKQFLRLTNVPGEFPGNIEVTIPDAFQADFDPDHIMKEIRAIVYGLRTAAPFLPYAQIEAARRLYAAINSAWVTPTPEVVAAAEDFVATGQVDKGKAAAINAAHEYWSTDGHHGSEKTRSDEAIESVEAAVRDLPALIAQMRAVLPSRFYQDSEHAPQPLPDDVGVIRRAETSGEVMRAAAIAGVDAIELVAAARAGDVDVLLVDSQFAANEWRMEDEKSHRDWPLAGVRLIRSSAPDAAEDYFVRPPDPHLQAALAGVSYPAHSFPAPMPELKP